MLMFFKNLVSDTYDYDGDTDTYDYDNEPTKNNSKK
jgi:hypothetical protein